MLQPKISISPKHPKQFWKC